MGIERDEIKELVSGAVNKGESVIDWINQPKEMAREFLVDSVKNDTFLTTQEKASLIYNSRKFTREYANSKKIYEKAKCNFNENNSGSCIEDDWLHFFFDKAGKVSNSSMQNIWAKLLAGEFNSPNSVSKKLIHIISIMDVKEAQAFKKFCLYTFFAEDVLVTFMPDEYSTSKWFDFKYKIGMWIAEAGYINNIKLTEDITLGPTDFTSLENIGLIHKNLDEAKICMPLKYFVNDDIVTQVIPLNGSVFEIGQYSLSYEGRQLYKVLNMTGDKVIVSIMEKYLKEKKLEFGIEYSQSGN